MALTGFKGSSHFIQTWAQRYNLHNIALCGAGGSADAVGAADRVAEIRDELGEYNPERIFQVDETGLFLRCIPNRAYVVVGQRRGARSTKEMKANDRVALVMTCNATGSHKIPVAIVGKATQPLCFKPPRAACPLPYFSRKSAWMDKVVYRVWLVSRFRSAVAARGIFPRDLIYENCGAHGHMCRGWQTASLLHR